MMKLKPVRLDDTTRSVAPILKSCLRREVIPEALKFERDANGFPVLSECADKEDDDDQIDPTSHNYD